MNTAVTLVNYPELPAALTIEEHDLLQQCEQIIHDGIDIFYDVANALATVNKRKLYRDTYNTFEAYCREKWDMGRAQAYRLIDADEVKENLSSLGDTTPLPEKESHIRALKQAPAEKQAEVWKDVVDSGDPVTAPRIKQAVQEVLPKPTHSTLGGMTAEEVNAWREKPQVIHTYNTEGTITKTLIISKDHRTHAKPDDLKRVVKAFISLRFEGLDAGIDAFTDLCKGRRSDLCREIVQHCESLFIMYTPMTSIAKAFQESVQEWQVLQQEEGTQTTERLARIGKYYETKHGAFKVLEYDEDHDHYIVENVVTHEHVFLCPSQTDTGCEESYIQSVYLENTQCNGNCHTCQNPCKNRKPIDDRHNQSFNKEYDERQKDTAGTYEWWFAHCTMDRWLIWYRWQKYREDFGKIQVDSMKLKGTVRELERKYAEQSSKYEELSNLYLNLKKQAELKA